MLVLKDKVLKFKFLEVRGLVSILVCSFHLLYPSKTCFYNCHFYFCRQFLVTLMKRGTMDNPRDTQLNLEVMLLKFIMCDY